MAGRHPLNTGLPLSKRMAMSAAAQACPGSPEVAGVRSGAPLRERRSGADLRTVRAVLPHTALRTSRRPRPEPVTQCGPGLGFRAAENDEVIRRIAPSVTRAAPSAGVLHSPRFRSYSDRSWIRRHRAFRPTICAGLSGAAMACSSGAPSRQTPYGVAHRSEHVIALQKAVKEIS
jgi:hypothetical protein